MRRIALALLLATTLLAGCAGGDAAAPATSAPAGGGEDGSTGSGEVLCPEPTPGSLPEPGCEPTPGTGQEAELVTPRPGMAGTRPIPWTGAEPIGDGATLRVTWISGVEPCQVLDRVEVAETETEVQVTLVEGSDPASPDAVCIELGVSKAVEVDLSAPLGERTVVDGAA